MRQPVKVKVNVKVDLGFTHWGIGHPLLGFAFQFHLAEAEGEAETYEA